MLQRIRRSVALKLILASALPSALVLLVGLTLLINHTQEIALLDAKRAFQELKTGALIGSALTLTFAALAVALTTRRFLVKPAHHLSKVMARAEQGEFLVRAGVDSEDELGRLAHAFNTMLARITELTAAEIETKRSLEQMTREIGLQNELQAANQLLASHIREMELLLDVAAALSGTLELPEQLELLGRHMCARLGVGEFSALLLDDVAHQLVVEAVAGDAPEGMRGLRFNLGEGIAGDVAARGTTIYVEDAERDPRSLHAGDDRRGHGSLVSVPLRAKGRILGVMNLRRLQVAAFTAQEIRLAEAIAAEAALAISNARLYQQTLELSYTDPLTGIPNRRQLFFRLEQELSRAVRFGDELSILMIDLDLFKRVNDSHGHPIGDTVLRGVAIALRRNVRKVDVIARYGGEEFVVVLPRVARAEAMEVAEKLRRAVAATPLPSAQDEPPLHVTISVGVASYGADATDVAALIERADAALYAAKGKGRNQVVSAEAGGRGAA